MTNETHERPKVTVPELARMKALGEKICMITAYDVTFARLVDIAGVDMILVGDSLAMVVLGYDDTLQVTTDDMAHHVGAVARTRPNALVVADLPFGSYRSARNEASSSIRLMKEGAECVKLEERRRDG
jgi:3-methyl-2-oxobutanoate hydroxymethyltransferase